MNDVKKDADIRPALSHIDQVIDLLEKARESKVIVYITGDRKVLSGMPLPFDLSTKVAPDILPLFNEVLDSINTTEKITLVIYTNGGLIETPWPLVNLIREYCKELEVIILKKALSAGTLIALGADKIIMPRGTFLSPVDPAALLPPKGTSPQPFQPTPMPQMPPGGQPMPFQAPQMLPPAQKQVEIEDIIGFIDFAKDKVGINDQKALGEVLKELSQEIDPSTMGSINRTHSLIRKLAEKLLDLHSSPLSQHQKKELVEQLTEKLFSHKHLINSREAKTIGFDNIIEIPAKSTEKIINSLYEKYRDKMKLMEPLNVDKLANESPEVNEENGYSEECLTALIHSKNIKYNFKTNIQVKATPNPQGGGKNININVINPTWVKE